MLPGPTPESALRASGAATAWSVENSSWRQRTHSGLPLSACRLFILGFSVSLGNFYNWFLFFH